MKVILLQDVPNLGRRGEVKEVNIGYASNFLLPKKLAIIATAVELEKLKIKKEEEIKEKRKQEEEMKKIAEKINGLKLEIREKADENGTLYGGVDEKKIAEVLESKGIKIEPEKIHLPSHLKKIGEYETKIKLLPELIVKINIIIKASA